MGYFDRIWEAVPPGAEPLDFALRREHLLGFARPGLRVLDLGCGEGLFTSALLDAGADAVAADVAAEPLRRALERDPRLRTVRLADGPLPFADGEFELVWAGELLEHVQDVVGLLDEVHRVLLRPGGLLVLSTPAHPPALRLRLALSAAAFERHFDPRSDHVRFFTARSLRRVLSDAGFAAIDVRSRRGHLLVSCAASAGTG